MGEESFEPPRSNQYRVNEMTVRIYHNHDTDAPVLGRTAGSLIDVLDAILVTGYGDKQPLGWTKEFHEGNIAVFRNDPNILESTGMYLRVDDSYGDIARVQCYKTMSDISTGTDVIPNLITHSQEFIYWSKHYNGTASPKRWSVIGDERTFYMNVATAGAYPEYPGNSYSEKLYGAGDFISYIPGNEWNYMLFGSGRNSATSAYDFPGSSGSTGERPFYIGRSMRLEPDRPSEAYHTCLFSDPGHHSNQREFNAYSGERQYMRALIEESHDGTQTTGHLRGGYWFLGRTSDKWFENMGKVPGDPTGPDLRNFHIHSNYNRCSIMIKEDDWDA